MNPRRSCATHKQSMPRNNNMETAGGGVSPGHDQTSGCTSVGAAGSNDMASTADYSVARRFVEVLPQEDLQKRVHLMLSRSRCWRQARTVGGCKSMLSSHRRRRPSRRQP